MTLSPTDESTRRILKEAGALKSGHFVLSSGLHSANYCQCATLFETPALAEQVAGLMAELLPEDLEVDVVLSPALGGILWGYELARALRCRTIFAERKAGEPFELRRGFTLAPGQKVLLAEDVVTTGGSVMELVPLMEKTGAVVVGIAAVADRSRGAFQPSVPFFALAKLDFATYKPEDCPLCAQGIPVEKPGSRAAAKPGA